MYRFGIKLRVFNTRVRERCTYTLASYEFIANAVLFTSIIGTICEAVARADYNFPMAADPSIPAWGRGRFQFVGRSIDGNYRPDGRPIIIDIRV